MTAQSVNGCLMYLISLISLLAASCYNGLVIHLHLAILLWPG